MYESHAEDKNQWMAGRKSNPPRAVCQVDSVDTNSMPNDALADLGELIRHLLPTPAVAPQRASPIPSDCELLVQCLLETVHPVQPVIRERSSITGMEVLLQSMLPVASVAEDTVHPRTDSREPMTRCFSCGESDNTTRRCLELDETFPLLPAGWRVDREDHEFVLRPPPKGPTCHTAGNVDWSGEGAQL